MTAPGGYRLGIDLGTTYTAAAVARGTAVDVVGLGNRASAIPSVIHLAEDDTVLAGEAADRRGPAEPDRVAREFKRRVGDPTPLLLGGAPHSAEALTAMLLRHVIDKVTELEGGPPDELALTYPANWGPYKQDLLAQSVRLAGASTTMTLTEPEAAAIAYAANERVEPGSVIAVYDLGGGTFDAAVLRKSPDGFDILGRPEGIERLGGIDFDEAVVGHVRTALGDALDDCDIDDPAVLAALTRLRAECTAAKEALSSDTETSIPVILPGLQTHVRLTRSELEQMVRPTLVATVDALRRALSSADVEPDDVTAVLMVGGSSRMPLVAELVSDAFDRPVAVDAHPKHAIASGAAIALERRTTARPDSDTAAAAVAVAALGAAQSPDPAARRATEDTAADEVRQTAATAAEPPVSPRADDVDPAAWTLPPERGGNRPLRRVLLTAAAAIALMGLLVVGAAAVSRPGTPTDAGTDTPSAPPAVRAIEVPDDEQAPPRTRGTTGGTRDEQPVVEQPADDHGVADDHQGDETQQTEPPHSEAPAAGDAVGEGEGAEGEGAEDHGAGDEPPPVDDPAGGAGGGAGGDVGGGAGDVADPGTSDEAAADTSGTAAAPADEGVSAAASEAGEPGDTAGPAPAQ